MTPASSLIIDPLVAERLRRLGLPPEQVRGTDPVVRPDPLAAQSMSLSRYQQPEQPPAPIGSYLHQQPAALTSTPFHDYASQRFNALPSQLPPINPAAGAMPVKSSADTLAGVGIQGLDDRGQVAQVPQWKAPAAPSAQFTPRPEYQDAHAPGEHVGIWDRVLHGLKSAGLGFMRGGLGGAIAGGLGGSIDPNFWHRAKYYYGDLPLWQQRFNDEYEQQKAMADLTGERQRQGLELSRITGQYEGQPTEEARHRLATERLAAELGEGRLSQGQDKIDMQRDITDMKQQMAPVMQNYYQQRGTAAITNAQTGQQRATTSLQSQQERTRHNKATEQTQQQRADQAGQKGTSTAQMNQAAREFAKAKSRADNAASEHQRLSTLPSGPNGQRVDARNRKYVTDQDIEAARQKAEAAKNAMQDAAGVAEKTGWKLTPDRTGIDYNAKPQASARSSGNLPVLRQANIAEAAKRKGMSVDQFTNWFTSQGGVIQ